MSDEYIKTLEIRAQTGNPDAVKAYKNAIAHRESVQKSTQKFASNLRSEGTDVRYRPDGGIEFDLDQQTNSQKPMTQTAANPQSKRKFKIRFSKNERTDVDKSEEKEEKTGWSPLLLCICFLLGLLLALAIAWNVQPFQDFIKLLANRIDFTDFSAFLFALPGIGGLFQWIAEFFAAVLGIMLYAIFQGLELAPYLYKRNPKRMRQILEQWATWARYRPGKNDDRAVRSIKRSYNNHPIRTYQTLCTTRNLIYLLELAICFITHPPVTDGNLFTFLWYLVTFQIGKIDWINVLLMFSVLFLVDRIVRIILSIYPEIFPKKEETAHA